MTTKPMEERPIPSERIFFEFCRKELKQPFMNKGEHSVCRKRLEGDGEVEVTYLHKAHPLGRLEEQKFRSSFHMPDSLQEGEIHDLEQQKGVAVIRAKYDIGVIQVFHRPTPGADEGATLALTLSIRPHGTRAEEAASLSGSVKSLVEDLIAYVGGQRPHQPLFRVGLPN